ncbi:MAG TPA: tetratricopeptide repeat protein, partial [Pyrinomonadaceae bacterium]|nr:tetratricopeptide repeat protein [Pyrinomonadaceae bacterium]
KDDKPMKLLVVSFILMFSAVALAQGAQGGGHTLYGDVKVDESKASGINRLSYDLILYSLARQVIARQTVSSNGRYRFNNLSSGVYDLAVELENVEVARIRVELVSPLATDQRQDINLELRAPGGSSSAKPALISVEDYYHRTAAHQKLFERAQVATDKKKYAEAVALFNELLAGDPKDFQAWSELGTVYLLEQKPTEAEKAYGTAIEIRPKFFLGLMNLARLRMMQKNFEGAIEPLTAAVGINGASADANAYLGEAYLQIKKGSKAVVYLNEAIKLDPVGKADLHLRLATLYNAVGMKDKAAKEYDDFLKKKPDYPDAKKLRDYIDANKPKQ